MKRTFFIDVIPVYKPGDPRPEGYLERQEWSRVQHKAGLRQKKCRQCGLWRYPQELSGGECRLHNGAG